MEITQLIRPNILELEPYHSARESIQAGTLLDANENPYDQEWEGVKLNRYPDPRQRRLREALARYLEIESDQVLAGVGSDEVLDWILKVFCQPGRDQIAIAEPTYGMYQVMADIFGISSFRFQLDRRFQFRFEPFLASVPSEVKVLFLCSPNNPTANSFEGERIVQLLENFRGLVIVDEAYIDFSAEESWASKLQEYPNLVVTQTLSKAYGLAGIRLGICYASAEIIAILNKIKPPYNVNELTQKRALERVLDDASVQNEITAILRERDALSKVLLEVNFVEKVYPSEANFILAKVDDANKRYEQLIKRGIVVRNRSTQALCENTLRFTVGTSEENQKLISALKELV